MGDEQPRRSKPPDLLRYQSQYETSSTQQTRSKGGKVTTNTVRNNVVRRADVGAEVRCMKLAAAQMSQGEWQAYIALKEGVLFDPMWDGATIRTWRVVPPPAKSATVEQVARHYGMRTETVERYERSARRILDMIRAAAGLTGDYPSVPIWPAIQNDETLLRFLFPSNSRK